MKKVPNSVKLVDKHLDKFVNDDDVFVIHEIESEVVHSDIYVIKPYSNSILDCYILMTCGLSAKKMQIPKGISSPKYAEIVMLLPSDWNMDYEEFKNEDNWWPFRLLKTLSKYPHTENTWLGYGHTYSYLEGETFSENCEFEGVILLDSTLLPEEFMTIKRWLGRSVKIWSAIPLYRNEIAFKNRHGTGALLKLFEAKNLSEIVQVGRENLLKD